LDNKKARILEGIRAVGGFSEDFQDKAEAIVLEHVSRVVVLAVCTS